MLMDGILLIMQVIKRKGNTFDNKNKEITARWLVE